MQLNFTPAVTLTQAADNSEELVRFDYVASGPVTTGAWTQLVAATTRLYKGLEIFDSSGETLEIGVGGVGSEVPQVFIFPGGNGKIGTSIVAGSRISVRAKSNSAAVGEITVNGIY